MHVLCVAVCCVVAVLALIGEVQPADAAVYEVEPGDSLSGIADQHGISLGLLLALNPAIDVEAWLMPGQPLQVPDPDAGPAAETRPAPDVPDFALSPYVVQPGDTLSGIAAEQGIPLALVLALNPDQAPDLLRAGAVLQVPAAGVPPPRDAEAAAGRWRLSAYVVQPGDTLWDIATAHAIPLALLEQLNPTTESGTLRVGDRLRVPITDVDAAQADTAHILDYAVQPGDTASAIAATHGIALADLATANPDRDLDQIAVGEVLRVPLAGTSVGAPAPAVGRPVLLNPVGGRETMVRRWGAPNGPYGLHRAIDFFVPAGTLGRGTPRWGDWGRGAGG